MRFLLLVLLFFACATSRSQQAKKTADFYLDPVGKLYYLLTDDRLITDNPLGQNRFEFYDSSLGAPDLVDVTNPFAILLYYEAYGQIVVLDRTLSEVSRLDLFSLEDILEPAALARAADNNVWVFDGWDYRLKLLNAQGAVSQQSNDLRLELKLADPPDHIYVDRTAVILHFQEAQELAIFTNYGRFETWVDLPEGERFGWHAPFLLGTSASSSWLWRRKAPIKHDIVAQPQVQGQVVG
ncbi:MAG: hypothetical protein AAGA62_14415, partial [Bacteroidota bacterium]